MNKINSKPISISVIVPVLNESETILDLSRSLIKVLDGLCCTTGKEKKTFEVLFIDDGSSDKTWEIITSINKKDPRIGGLRLSRNFGHHLALTAGLDRARGEAVVLMDGDLQDPPEEIPKLYALYKDGFDLIYAIRKKRHDPIIKRVNSRLFWWVINRITGLDMPANQMLLRLLSRKLVNVLLQMKESGRFVHGMMAWAGFRVTTVNVKHRERRVGTSKYNTLRQLQLAIYAVTSFSITPLRFASLLGLITSFGALIFGLYLIMAKILLGYSVEGWASIMTSIFLLAGLQFLLLGVIGEYIGKTFKEVQNRPLYVISEAL